MGSLTNPMMEYSILQVEHTFLQLALHTTVPQSLRLFEYVLLGCGTASCCSGNLGEAHEKLVEVASPAFAGEISIVRGGRQADSLRSPSKGVADGVRQVVKVIRIHAHLITDDVVMGWASRSLQAAMGLEEKVVFVDSGDTAIDNCTRFWISVVVSIYGLCGVKSSMVPLATNNHRQLGTIRALGSVKLLERSPDLGNFFFDDNRELALDGGHIR